MSEVKTIVAKSYDVKDAALNLNVKSHEVRRTLAAVWNLAPTERQPPSPEAAFSLDMKNEGQESVVGSSDERRLVDKVHFAPGGKYRSIVKLFIRYEFQKLGGWAMGTGWLIRPDIFVTAGHCSYDWSRDMGRATEVKAYIGYDGNQSEKDPSVQFRYVKRAVTTEGWVKAKGQKPFDVSFMQVDVPFTGITPVRFEETPSEGDLILGVVGYPGDLSDKRTNEKGGHMYECFMRTQFDLSKQADTMLEYEIDTFGGNSGSPVFRQHDLVSIGAHVYGGALNTASVIGKYGNPYGDYIAAFGLPLPNDALNLIPVTGNRSISAPVPAGYGSSIPVSMVTTGPTRYPFQAQHSSRSVVPQAQSRSQRERGSIMTKLIQNGGVAQSRNVKARSPRTEAEEDGFMNVLKVAGSSTPGSIGSLAGFALNAASDLTAKSVDAESTMDGSTIHEGSMERAILAEATLSALQSAQLPSGLEDIIFSDMEDKVMGALPVVRKAAPLTMGAMMEPALKMALDSLHNYDQKVATGAESFEADESEPFRPTVLYSPEIDNPADHQTEAFLRLCQASLRQNSQESAMDGDSEESYRNLIRAGTRIPRKGVLAAVKHGLPILVDVMNQSGSAESFEDGPSSGPASHFLAADPLAQRALVADAALEAVMSVPPEQLQEEGLLDKIIRGVKKHGPTAMKVATVVAGAIEKSTDTDEPTIYGSRASRRIGNQGLSAKRSLHALRSGSTHGDSRSKQRARDASRNGDYSRFGRRLEY